MIDSRFTVGLALMLVSSTISFAVDDTITLLAGRELHVQFITELSSKTNETGDMWTGKVVEPVFGKGGEIVPDGSTVDGHITFVKNPGQAKAKSKDKDQGEIMLIADSISTPDGTKYNIVATPQAGRGAQPKDQGTGALSVPGAQLLPKG